MKPDTAFVLGLDFFGDAVRRLGPEDWELASPCQGWRALDVLGHVGQATRFGTALLQGTRPDWSPVDPPGALVEGPPGVWWTGLAGPARDAVDGVDLSREMDSPAGRRSVGDGLSFPALDLYIHGWDIARACGRPGPIPGPLAGEILEVSRLLVTEADRPGRFGSPVPLSPQASVSDRLLAYLGRNPL